MGSSAFGARVATAVGRTGPLCAGIDPSPALLSAWDLPDSPAGLRTFGGACVEAFAGVAAVVKPQVAFFERHGAAGMAALEAVLADARAAGLVAVADAKRADIASTAEAYAAAWLTDGSPLAADALTVVPYLGLGALGPMVAAAREGGRGIFVVVRSSNPEGRVVQEALTAGGRSVEGLLLAEIAALNRDEVGGTSGADGEPAVAVGSVGAVVGTVPGADVPDVGLSGLGGVVLVPGFGAQGGTASQVAALCGGCPRGTVLVNVSRSLLAAGPSAPGLRRAALRVREQLAAAIG